MKKQLVKFLLVTMAVLFMFSLTANTVAADEILFLNGDRLTGTVTNINNGNVTFNPELMGIVRSDRNE